MKTKLFAGLLGCLLIGCGCEKEQNPVRGSGNIEGAVIDANDYSSVSCPQKLANENAMNGYSLMLEDKQSASYNQKLEPNSAYSVVVRYSNGFGADWVSVSANGSNLGEFEARLTGNGKEGWRTFADSPAFYMQTGSSEDNSLTIKIERTESIGAEFDTITLTRQ